MVVGSLDESESESDEILDFNRSMVAAADYGYQNSRIMLSHGATDFDNAMIAAARRGYRNIVELMLSHGATDFDNAMVAATWSGNINKVRLMQERMNSPSS